jgi:hypothetical protein
MRYRIFIALAISLTGCITAADHQRALHSSAERDLTVGIVQAKITKGMPMESVAAALGSPNIVKKDKDGGDVWIYDKIASEASYSNDTGGGSGLLGAGGTPGSALILGGLTGSYERSQGANALTQKTLTVIISFDGRGQVEDFSYHSSKF